MRKILALLFVILISFDITSVLFAESIVTPNVGVNIKESADDLATPVLSSERKKQLEEQYGNRLYITNDKYVTTGSETTLNLKNLPDTILRYIRIIMVIIIMVSFLGLLAVGILYIYNIKDSRKIDEYKSIAIYILIGLIFFTFFSISTYLWILDFGAKQVAGKDKGHMPELNLIR